MATRDLVGEELQSTYRLDRIVGRGGSGVVYQASHLRLPRQFAVKVLAPGATDAEAFGRLRREAEITSRIVHPHIVEVMDFNYMADGSPYFVMELLQGEDLASRLGRPGDLVLDDVGSILRQTAAALHAAHTHGVVHRDLKPRNVFLCQRGRRDDFVKVMDFGISKVLDSQTLSTTNQKIMGTARYMAPEQADGRPQDIDQRTDIFAMGLILYEMLAGQPAFAGRSPPAVLYQIVHGQPPQLEERRPGMPAAFQHLIDKALSKRPEHRFESMEAFWQAFVDALDYAPAPSGFTEDRSFDSLLKGEVVASATTRGDDTESGLLTIPMRLAFRGLSEEPLEREITQERRVGATESGATQSGATQRPRKASGSIELRRSGSPREPIERSEGGGPASSVARDKTEADRPGAKATPPTVGVVRARVPIEATLEVPAITLPELRQRRLLVGASIAALASVAVLMVVLFAGQQGETASGSSVRGGARLAVAGTEPVPPRGGGGDGEPDARALRPAGSSRDAAPAVASAADGGDSAPAVAPAADGGDSAPARLAPPKRARRLQRWRRRSAARARRAARVRAKRSRSNKPRPASPRRTLAATPPTRQPGTLIIQSKRKGDQRYIWADAYLDGKHVGQTGLILKAVPAGVHTISLRRAGYGTLSKLVRVRPGERKKIRFVLERNQ